MEKVYALSPKSYRMKSNRALQFWKISQTIFWLIGILLLLIMFLKPSLGALLFWNILIPVAPALLVVGTGVWRNICPLATTSLLPDRFKFSRKRKLPLSLRSKLNVIGGVALFLIIPLRHVVFNTDGQATALLIIALATAAFIGGSVYERKSFWCSGLCPIHNVEKLYGTGVAFTLPNAHCNDCIKCTVPCADSTSNINILSLKKSVSSKAIEYLMLGAFPGYIWGWFQVPDFQHGEGWRFLNVVYGFPLLGATGTFVLYLLLSELLGVSKRKQLMNVFAASAVSCYYWFRLPLLFGFGDMSTNSTLVDLSNNLPSWAMLALNVITTTFFFWWMVIRNKTKRSWSVRPEYAS